jgi:hypothetical protein
VPFFCLNPVVATVLWLKVLCSQQPRVVSFCMLSKATLVLCSCGMLRTMAWDLLGHYRYQQGNWKYAKAEEVPHSQSLVQTQSLVTLYLCCCCFLRPRNQCF